MFVNHPSNLTNSMAAFLSPVSINSIVHNSFDFLKSHFINRNRSWLRSCINKSIEIINFVKIFFVSLRIDSNYYFDLKTLLQQGILTKSAQLQRQSRIIKFGMKQDKVLTFYRVSDKGTCHTVHVQQNQALLG